MQSCGDNIFNLEALLKMNYVEWLQYLTYMKQKGEIELFLDKTKNGSN